MHRFFLILLFLACLKPASEAQSPASPIYSGGMLMLQPGISYASNPHESFKGVSFGLGGILRFYFRGNFTAGITGHSHKTTYTTSGSEHSTLSLGYGGPFAGYSKGYEKFRVTAGVFGGMGTLRNLHIDQQTGNLIGKAYLYRHRAYVFSPLISLDFHLTAKLSLVIQAMVPIATYDKDRIYINPAAQIGVVFNR
jgi:hypothetical protein